MRIEEVIEGNVDRVVWPKNLARYREHFFPITRARSPPSGQSTSKTLERYLLLANDFAGLKFSTKLEASKTTKGASTLIVDVAEKPIDANARFDNRGTPSRGRISFLTSGTLNNIFGQHEALTLTWAATTQLKELEYFPPTTARS